MKAKMEPMELTESQETEVLLELKESKVRLVSQACKEHLACLEPTARTGRTVPLVSRENLETWEILVNRVLPVKMVRMARPVRLERRVMLASLGKWVSRAQTRLMVAQGPLESLEALDHLASPG